jgi:hypothetical protein
MEDVSTIKFVLWLSGIIITLLLTVVGFFLARIVSDVKGNTLDIGKNKGAVELIKQKQESDIERVEKTTQLELQTLTKQVGGLAESVNTLVTIQMSKGNK